MSELCSQELDTPKNAKTSTSQVTQGFSSSFEMMMASPTHILIVEDNKIAQIAVQTLLSTLNCLVDVASNGIDALNLCKQYTYDLVFMDIGLGEGMDGYETTKQIRMLPKTMPIIALTAHAGDDNKSRCMDAGMNEVLTKPLTKIQAIEILTTFLPMEHKE